MDSYNRQRGQSLIEILFAIALFTIGVVTLGYIVLDAFVGLRHASESTQARLLAREGIEAVRSLRDNNFADISVGVYGLTLNEGQFTLTEAPDTQGKYSRTITVEERDDELREVISSVTWDSNEAHERTVSLITLLSNWVNMNGDAQYLAVESTSLLTASGTATAGIVLSNTSDENITVTNMDISWDTSALLSSITLGEVALFVADGVPVESGTVIDTVDHELAAEVEADLSYTLIFDRNVAGINCVVTLILGDGSKRHLYLAS